MLKNILLTRKSICTNNKCISILIDWNWWGSNKTVINHIINEHLYCLHLDTQFIINIFQLDILSAISCKDHTQALLMIKIKACNNFCLNQQNTLLSEQFQNQVGQL